MTNKHWVNQLMGETTCYSTSIKNILKRQVDQLSTHLDYYNTQERQKWAANNKRELAVPFQFPDWKNKQT